ncbi:MAG: twitching motility protein PilT, partial [Betaproteobacteria bacterium SG8_40]
MFLDPLLKLMAEKNASDLFISAGAPISIKILDNVMPVNQTVIDGDLTSKIAHELMNEKQTAAFETEWEMNFSHVLKGVGRFRVNVFRQRGQIGLVVRYLRSGTPGIDKLKLPKLLKELVMEKRGFVLVVGSTGSGKSTTLAAMIEHRNALKAGHILTIEDPMEFVFKNDKCVINQREVGTDTHSYEHALVNAMREA